MILINAAVVAKARLVWETAIDQGGKTVTLIGKPNSGVADKTLKGLARRPKILGQWDRTQGSYDQEKWMLLLKAEDFPDGPPEKFMRANWDGKDHMFLEPCIPVELQGDVFGYRIICKG